MGVKTLYEYFYKLAYGDKGADKATLVNDCLDVADAAIKANLDAFTTKQPLDAGLTSIAGLTTTTNKMIYTTALDTYAVASLTAFARTILDDADATTVRATISAAVLGANSDITSLTGLTTPLGAAYGGTGVANNALNTITFTGNYTLGLTLTANTSLTLPTSGTLITTALKLSAFAATTSAELAGVISDETGTLKLVFADSPTFTTKITTPIIDLTGGQVTFPASQNASADANTLDDYEEGTWTPALKFGGNSANMTYNKQAGLYTKTGRQITITMYILLTNKGTSTGVATIAGIPFACKNDDGANSALSLRFTNITFANFPQGSVAKGTSTIYLEETTDGGAMTSLTNDDFANNSTIILTATYFTD